MPSGDSPMCCSCGVRGYVHVTRHCDAVHTLHTHTASCRRTCYVRQSQGRALQLVSGNGGAVPGVCRSLRSVSSKDGTVASLAELAVGAISVPRPLRMWPRTQQVTGNGDGGSGSGGGTSAADSGVLAGPWRAHGVPLPCHQSTPATQAAPVPAPGHVATLKLRRDDGSAKQSLSSLQVRCLALLIVCDFVIRC